MSTPNLPQQRPSQAALYDFLFVLRRKKWLILLCLAGVLAPIVYHNQTALPVYQAGTMVIFEESKQPISTFDLSSAFQRRSFITNQIEEIRSRTLSEEVARFLPEETVAKFSFPDPLPPKFDRVAFTASKIREGLSTQTVRESDIIKISIQGNDPEVCSIVANTVAEVMKLRSVEVRREEIRSVRDFVEEQLSIFSDQLRKAEESLKTFKEENRVTSLNEESREILERITGAETLYNRERANRGATERQLAYVQEKLREQREKVVPSIVEITSSWARKLKDELIDLEVQYTTLQVQGYPGNHVKMVELRGKIDQTKESLTQEVLKIADGENMLDPLSEIPRLLQQSISLQADLEAYRSKEDALKAIIGTYDQALGTLPEKELRLAQLVRARDVNDRIYIMLLEKREEARITEAGKISNLRVIDPAVVPSSPIKPRKRMNLLLGLIAGMIVGVGLAIFTESLDTSLRTIEDVEQSVKMAVLGSIPSIRVRRGEGRGDEVVRISARLVTQNDSKSSVAEAYRSLRTNIQFSSPDKPLRVLMVTSAAPKEGKSTTVANLAITMAQQGTRTLLVDTDLRRPVLHRLFGQDREPGLINVLAGSAEIDDVIRETDVKNLYLLTCGILPPNPSEMVGSERMKALLEQLKATYDIVLMDSPPTIAVTDAMVLGSEVDAVCLMIHSGNTSQDTVLRAKTLLENVKANVIGAVLNDVDVESLYGSYGYYYYYHYTSSHEEKGKSKKRK